MMPKSTRPILCQIAVLSLALSAASSIAHALDGKSLTSCAARARCQNGSTIQCRTYGDAQKKTECTWSVEAGDYVHCTGFDKAGNWQDVFQSCNND